VKRLKGKQTYSSTPDSDRKQEANRRPRRFSEHFESIIKGAAYM
jgi:hypothetical protein